MESRCGGIWILRSELSSKIDQALTEADILFDVTFATEDFSLLQPERHWSLNALGCSVSIGSHDIEPHHLQSPATTISPPNE